MKESLERCINPITAAGFKPEVSSSVACFKKKKKINHSILPLQNRYNSTVKLKL